MTHNQPVYRQGRVHVLTERCSTCIFRPNNLMHLTPGRVKSMVDECIADGGVIPCHQTLDSVAPAICRGFFDAHKDRIPLVQLADRLGVVAYDTLPKR